MESTIKIKVFRHDPEVEKQSRIQEYEVPIHTKSTVLEALFYIQENIDSSLAFSYSCRFMNCGLCTVEVNGNACLACITEVVNGMTISPLKALPLIRDLVVDRTPPNKLLATFNPFVVRESPPETEPEVIIQPQAHTQLMNCTECMACLSSCPNYDHTKTTFGGPYTFVKLAQLFYDKRDSMDRVKQALALGVESCTACSGCICSMGIPIHELAVETFLKEAKGR